MEWYRIGRDKGMEMINKLPKKHRVKIDRIEAEGGLIDGCKYMVYLKDGYEHYVYGISFPIKHITELREFIMGVDLV